MAIIKSPLNEASATTLRPMLEAALALSLLQAPLPHTSPNVSSKVLTKIMPAEKYTF